MQASFPPATEALVFALSRLNTAPYWVRYSRRGMSAASNISPTGAKTSQSGFIYAPLIAGWLVPGAGHFLLRKWGRGALLALSILTMFALGLAMQGKVYSGAHDILDLLGLVGDLGSGLLYIASRVL